MVSEREVRVWADEQGLSNLALAEQDYRLVKATEAIYADDFLSPRMCMKGDTAINKLYLKETSRLSADLDFNHIGKKESVLKERKDVRERITELLRMQDPSCRMEYKRRYEQTTIKARYRAAVGTDQHLKIEVSHVERFPLLGSVTLKLEAPNTSFQVSTYKLEELVATKLRALFERLKGRDIYDLYHASKLEQDKIAVRKMFLYYFYRSRKVFNPKLYFKNVWEKYRSGRYVDDVSGFIRPSTSFELGGAAEKVVSHYSFLGDLDERDLRFLILARYLLGWQVPKASLPTIQKMKLPLKELFGDMKISEEASRLTIENIKHYTGRKARGSKHLMSKK